MHHVVRLLALAENARCCTKYLQSSTSKVAKLDVDDLLFGIFAAIASIRSREESPELRIFFQ